MADLSQVPHVVPHVVHHVAAVKPVIVQGYTMLAMILNSVITAAISGGLAWYIRGRGWSGVQIDISNIKTDIENLKAKIEGTPVAAAA